jgi:hypothetical protein
MAVKHERKYEIMRGRRNDISETDGLSDIAFLRLI